MKKTVVVFNGPPGCGKDDAVKMLTTLYLKSHHKRFKDRLFEVTAAVYGVPIHLLMHDWYTRELKEQPREELDGLSPRQALIKVSEEVIKPNMGQDYFGRALANSLPDGITFVSDSGFFSELLPVAEEAGPENVLVVRIKGRGNYQGDSRNFLSPMMLKTLGVAHIDIENTGTLEEYLGEVMGQVTEWIEQNRGA